MRATAIAKASRAPVRSPSLAHVAQLVTRAEQLEMSVRPPLLRLLSQDLDGIIARQARTDPWVLVVASGLPLQIVDRWAEEDRIPRTRTRPAAAVIWAIRHALLNDGDMALPLARLAHHVHAATGDRPTLDALAVTVHQLGTAGLLEMYGDTVMLPNAAATEASLARRIAPLITARAPGAVRREALVRRRLADGTPLTPVQQEGVIAVASHRLVIIDGPAGTGKTTVIKEIHRIFTAIGDRVIGATPTGKAADVLLARGVPRVDTVHATLGLTPDDTDPESAPVGTGAPLSGTILIVDEGTMPDAIVYERLFAAVPEHMTVVLVGDVNQLLPVGPGSVYETLLGMAPLVRVVRLTEVRRTSGLLTENSIAICAGRMPRFTNPFGASPDYTAAWYDAAVIPSSYRELAAKAAKRNTPPDEITMDAAARWIVATACTTLMPAYGLGPHEFVQLITPQAPGPLGTIRLAGMMREYLNPLGLEGRDVQWKYADQVNTLRRRDPILVIGSVKAHDGTLLRNGTAVHVTAIDRAGRTFTVARDSGDEYVVPAAAARECILRYAMTVDRTQGSEYGVVVQITHDITARSLATRRRYYTGFTRARKASITWGTDERIRYCLANVGDRRYSTLARRIHERLAAVGVDTMRPVRPVANVLESIGVA